MTGPMQATTTPASRPTVPLEAFLAELPPGEAAEARAAAARIDALERRIGPPGWLERHRAGLGLGALALFTAGLALFIARAVGVGGMPGPALLVPMLAAFPALALGYLWSVRGRSRLDREKMVLNETHFLPHGGVYFGARDGGARVLRVEPPAAEAPNLRERAERLHAEVTHRRWWW